MSGVNRRKQQEGREGGKEGGMEHGVSLAPSSHMLDLNLMGERAIHTKYLQN